MKVCCIFMLVSHQNMLFIICSFKFDVCHLLYKLNNYLIYRALNNVPLILTILYKYNKYVLHNKYKLIAGNIKLLRIQRLKNVNIGMVYIKI